MTVGGEMIQYFSHWYSPVSYMKGQCFFCSGSSRFIEGKATKSWPSFEDEGIK